MAGRIRSDSKIQGFRIGEDIVDLSLFADDITCFLRVGDSYITLFHYHIDTILLCYFILHYIYITLLCLHSFALEIVLVGRLITKKEKY